MIVEWIKNHSSIVAGVLGVLAAVLLVVFIRPTDIESSDIASFTIETGWGVQKIADELKLADLIRSPFLFTAIVQLRGASNRIYAGTYELSKDMSLNDVVRVIISGATKSDDLTITIPEGANAWDVDRILLKAKTISHAGVFVSVYGVREGEIFPETYRIPKNATVQEIAQRFFDEFQSKASKYADDEIIIASLLEKEAKISEDMEIISGIIRERIHIGMLLQLDASVAYGWCIRVYGYKKSCDVTQSPIATEIKIDGPYNTYMRTGLPSGAISNPGLRALNAAAHPKSSDYLYYLSTRDGSQIIYSKTLAEHLSNRAKYLGF